MTSQYSCLNVFFPLCVLCICATYLFLLSLSTYYSFPHLLDHYYSYNQCCFSNYSSFSLVFGFRYFHIKFHLPPSLLNLIDQYLCVSQPMTSLPFASLHCLTSLYCGRLSSFFSSTPPTTVFQMFEDEFSAMWPDGSGLRSEVSPDLGAGFSSGFSSEASGSGSDFVSAWGSGEVYCPGLLWRPANSKRQNYSPKPEY